MSSAAESTREYVAQAVAFGLLAALGATVLVSSFGYGILRDGNRVGPGLLPMVAGLLLLSLSGWQLLGRLRGGTRGPVAAAPAGPGTDVPGTDVLGRTQADRIRQLRMVVVGLPITILLVGFLGFLPAFGIFVLFICAVVERRRPVQALLVTAVAVAAVYGIFGVFLDVPLPTGVVGDLFGS